MDNITEIPKNEQLEEEITTPNLNFSQKCRVIFNNITVEPILICYVIPSVMSNLAMQNLNLEKACRVDLNYNTTICDAMAQRNQTGYTPVEEEAVQKLVATAIAAKNIIQSLLPAMLLMFLGSWSDRNHRRKPCIILPISGEMITAIGCLICTYYFYELSLVYSIIAEAVPTAMAGSWCTMGMAVFSYISDVSTNETRTLRIGAVNLFSNISITIGIALSGILYVNIGFYGMFTTALVTYFVGLLYGIFLVKEIPRLQDKMEGVEINNVDTIKPKKKKSFIRDLFDLRHIRDTFAVAFKEGERNRKTRVCTIMILVMVIIGPMHGELNVTYLFVRYKYGWNEVDYSLFSTITFLAHLTGTIFSLMFLSKYLKMDDALLGVVSSMSKILSAFVYAFAPNSSIFYLGAIVEMLNGTSFIAMRSIISKLVPRDELGKIYSLFGVSEALMPLLYGPMYSFIYKATISYMPGAFFLAGGLLTVPSVIIFMWLYFEHQKDKKDELLRNEQDQMLINVKAKNN